MEFLARDYEDILLDYRFIRAIGVQLNLKSELYLAFRVLGHVFMSSCFFLNFDW